MKKTLWPLALSPLLLVTGCLMETGSNTDPSSTNPSTLASDQALVHTESVNPNGPGPHPLDPPPHTNNVGTVSSDGTVLTIQPAPEDHAVESNGVVQNGLAQ